MAVSTVAPTTAANGTVSNLTGGATKNAADTQDRFLKLLVAQMQNQDPMNPMDNAQVTSQMAQIQTVSGISTLDSSIKSLSSQFNQMQGLQSISLVGHTVTTPGNQLSINNGVGAGSYSLDAPASAVKLEVLNAAGVVMDTVQLGAQGAGQQSFSWPAGSVSANEKMSFRVSASNGSKAVTATTFAQDKVLAVNTSGTGLKLQLQNLGLIDYSKITSLN
ncbi:flagellar basal-body rod modification protein FlgD [Paucibacter oligotrophus]|uniref:Basal-body rod modification protein FlgD n=1 Tax=Roseateles oligotrophus TaxID=1769250 RepID=A0A840L4X5_9BURK|nr:flagellar hook capping FlgD N-terminal domain-containing protein [Roseateles oligotrophus]MBB4843604.1 flagellar basal-body rod modification protein FlgD [Roseateles oligotrophus]